jgi:diguanylate cyclase (GGDEF)-like protein
LLIHIPTLLLSLLTGFLLLCLQLQAAQRGGLQQQPALRAWAQGSWSLLLGYAFLGARVFMPLGASIFLGNAFIVLGLLLYHQALRRHLLDAPLQRWVWALAPAAWLLIALMLPWPLAQRTGVVSFVFAALLAPSIWLVLRHGLRAEASLRIVALTLSMAGLALLVRGVHAFVQPQDYTDLLQSSLGQGLTFLISFISLLGTGFGFVLACFERVTRRMEEMATLDGMTGCLNRSTTDTLLAHELERGRREGAPLAFALLDLDHFKQINDRHGHRAGDAALRAFADAVRARLRGSDVLGRVGGEEFGLILPATDAPGARRLLEDVRQAVAALRLTDGAGRDYGLTVSAGLAVAASDSGLSAERLYALADDALYAAKSAGRNRVHLSLAAQAAPA